MSSSTDTRRFSPLLAGGRESFADERVASRAAGYAEGWATGRRDAQRAADAALRQNAVVADALEVARTAQVERAVRALRAASDALDQRQLPSAEELADLIVESSLVLAQSVLDAELSVVDGRAISALRRAMTPLPTWGPVLVRLHPSDLATLGEVADAGRWHEHQVEFVADDSLSPGDAVAKQGPAEVDARVAAGLLRAATAMGSSGLS